MCSPSLLPHLIVKSLLQSLAHSLFLMTWLPPPCSLASSFSLSLGSHERHVSAQWLAFLLLYFIMLSECLPTDQLTTSTFSQYCLIETQPPHATTEFDVQGLEMKRTVSRRWHNQRGCTTCVSFCVTVTHRHYSVNKHKPRLFQQTKPAIHPCWQRTVLVQFRAACPHTVGHTCVVLLLQMVQVLQFVHKYNEEMLYYIFYYFMLFVICSSFNSCFTQWKGI